MFICKNCGSNMRFDPQTQKLVCRHCGTAVTAHEYKESRAISAQEHRLPEPEVPPVKSNPESPSTYEATVMTCPQCGGELLTTDETAATFCSFCGTSVLLQSRVSNARRPDFIIPFRLTKEACQKAYRKTLRRALYAPSDLAREAQIERFRGIYMPYWVYSFRREGKYETHGEKDHRRGDYIYTKHYRILTQVDAAYDGLSFDASASFSDPLSGAIAPFDFSQTEPFSPAYLSGFYADTNDVDASVYTEDAREIAKEHAARQLSRSRTYRKYHAPVDTIRLREGKPKLALYPVWFLSCRSRSGDRISYAAVNGQTGKVAADLPVDPKKMLLGTLLLAVPIFFLLNLLATLTPTKALLAATVLGLIGTFLANRQMNRIHQLENRLDDKGYLYGRNLPQSGGAFRKKARARPTVSLISLLSTMIFVFLFLTLSVPMLLAAGRGAIPLIAIAVIMILWRPTVRRRTKTRTVYPGAPTKEKMKILWKPMTGISLSLIIVAIAPVSDLYYYGGAIVSMLLIGWSFWDILQLHNRLTTRPLPQFDKRGGEEYEHIT